MREWYGFADTDPDLYIPKSLRTKHGIMVHSTNPYKSATRLNDNHKFSFAEIADCFEFNYLPDEYHGPAEDLEECQ